MQLLDDAEPWKRPEVAAAGQGKGRVIYLAADSPNELDTIEPGCTYVIGGVVDHTSKPGLSLDRAAEHGLETARLPLDRVIDFHCRAGESADITTLAVVQLLLLRREFDAPGFGEGGWGSAISGCPALRCAPLRKCERTGNPPAACDVRVSSDRLRAAADVKWRGEYAHLNDGVRPAQMQWLDGWGKEAGAARQ